MPPKTPMMPAEVPHHHPNVALISIISILIGLIAGAAGGYFAKDYIAAMLPGYAAPKTQSQEQDTSAAQAQSADTSATADSYANVDTNPLGDVQTNPF